MLQDLWRLLFHNLGRLLTLLGTFLAALKIVFTNVLQSPAPASTAPANTHPSHSPHPAQCSFSHGRTSFIVLAPAMHSQSGRIYLQLHPLDLIARMSSLAFVQCVGAAALAGELKRVHAMSAHEMDEARALELIANDVRTFGLNVVSFTAIKKVGR